ncbi:hypothetical protein [Pontibacter sp. G13]|uniref:hypothetical protein n=1 Tax=Pontibacter sp. G13 TaxID=3074898 RepID=UPI00288A619C|nr:hypothetical protein [Pontibacter sp. G13]WNJ20013.1 hypothetical protein RJD25_05975 [Pontibacter sp. G13]
MIKRSTWFSFYLLLTVVPLVLGVGYSFLYSIGAVGLLSQGVTLDHWANLLTTSETYSTLGYTLYLTVLSMAFVLLISTVLSHVILFERKPGSWTQWLFVPLTMAPLIAAFSMFQWLSPGGWLSRFCVMVGMTDRVEDFPRLTQDAASVGILVAHILLVMPLFTLIFLNQAHKERIPALRQQAFTLGANVWDFFRRVYVPLIWHKSRAVILLYGVFLMGTYEVPLLLGRQAPRVVTVLITEKLTKFDLANIPIGHAMAVLYAVLVLAITAFALRRTPSNSQL